jgi:hypothetical protein
VLEVLLSSTNFNYVIQSSNLSPDKIQAVVLMARTTDAVEPKAAVAANLTITPARRAWMASRNTGRPVGSPIPQEEDHQTEAEPAESMADEVTATPQLEPIASAATPVASVAKDTPTDGLKDHSKGLSEDTADPADSAAKIAAATASEPASAAIAPETATAGAAPDATQESPPAKELQNKINDMQQLFEQRKKMIANPAPPPN